MLDLYLTLITCTIAILLAILLCTRLILSALASLTVAQARSESETRTMIYRLRTAMRSNSWLDELLKKESESRL